MTYQTGFRNEFQTEVKTGILPVGQNAPQKLPEGLIAEQISGTAFTAPRANNFRTWVYRKYPSVIQGAPVQTSFPSWKTAPLPTGQTPLQLRWNPVPSLKDLSFLEGIQTYVATGDPHSFSGSAIHAYQCDRSMDCFFQNSDAEMVILPEQGSLIIFTELGKLEISPGFLGVIPRGILFRVEVQSYSRGYVCENYGQPFTLPELGPIGANGLAHSRDFETPCAFVDLKAPTDIITKFDGSFWKSERKKSPLDVYAWHGNYAPYRYHLLRFNTMGTVSVDHPDPSIYTVLTSPSSIPGTANMDFVIFPWRWLVGENTFRPPYYHRNVMSEFMGLIHGEYDAKKKGFVPGGASLHNCMQPHGPSREVFEKESTKELAPEKLENTLAFMFESQTIYRTTAEAQKTPWIQSDYLDCWKWD
ncbi:MAG: homogentisate 1,2-dioxygenase [Bdellovibrionaceae bacterium]|nr:homogentisate 1,2-dioxygenase [Pseudobdellovibrionaceae bacterium]|tara:strand:- start:764 stop:2011 length:1248 start_codon:yes stop_codon:yes gene_type:complete